MVKSNVKFPERLFEILKRETLMLEQLRDSAKEQQQFIVAMKAAEVQNHAMKQKAIWEHLRHLEDERIKLIATSFGMKPEDVRKLRLKDLVEVAVPEQTEMLRNLRNAFGEVTREVQEVTRFNRALIERSKNFFREALLFLTDGGQRYNKTA